MKNTFKIFKRDLKKIFTNSMAIILAVGIAVIPSLYAWFNIYANWDPYGSTGNMQVAVVIEDEGYTFKNIDIDVGSEIKSNLSANDLIDWQFVSKERALKGIEAGEYYAGIEIPKGFSKSLTSIVSDDFKQPKITYYANEKKNAIATKITDKVVQTIQQEVNESFVTTVINVVASLMDFVADATEKGAMDSLSGLSSKLRSASASIDSIQKTVDGFDDVISASKSLGEIIDKDKVEKISASSKELVNSGKDLTELLEKSMNSITSSVDDSLVLISDDVDEAEKLIESAKNSKTAKDAEEKLDEAQSKILEYKTLLETVESTLENVQDFLPVKLSAIDSAVEDIKKVISAAEKADSIITKIEGIPAKSDVNKINAEIDKILSGAIGIQSKYKKEIKPVVNRNLAALIEALGVTGDLINDLSGDMPKLKSAAQTLESIANGSSDLIGAINGLLNNIKKELGSLAAKIDGLGENELFNTIKNMASTNSEKMGDFIACPVIVETDKVYGIENYGSAMAPFYSTLAIWVGSMILIAVVKTSVKKRKEISEKLMPHQEYFGRMLTFVLFAVTQALIICLGDLYFFKIQCYHPLLFLLSGVFAAFVFSILIYSLTYTFGDIGKSVGIILLVVQIGGSGGTFPIDVCPVFFRAIHPYLPFTFVVNAMRECVCGTYSNDYWIDLLKLSAYLLIALVIGLGVKILVKKPIRFFEKQVEKTDLF